MSLPLVVFAAVFGGLYAYNRSATAAEAQLNAPTGLFAPITDPSSVRQYQTVLATLLAKAASENLPINAPGLTYTSYTSADIDGNPTNQRWMAAMALFQAAWNHDRASILSDPTITLTPDPTVPAELQSIVALRTDGVLDYATAIALINS